MDNDSEKIVGLDLGTTKVTCVAAIVNDLGGLEIIGVGNAPSHGMSQGIVYNMELTQESIVKAVAEAQRMAGCSLNNVYVGIAGAHIASSNSHGVIGVRDLENRVISEEDKKRALVAAETVNIPQGRVIIQSIPQAYKVDDVDGILDPLGMVGVRLEVRVHIITAAMNAYQNLTNCVNGANLNICDMILESIASAEAVMHPQEMDMGSVILDIGGGTTDIAIFCDGVIVHSAELAMGGDDITRELAVQLRTSIDSAEAFKVQFGCCLAELLESEQVVEVPSLGGAPQTFDCYDVVGIQEKKVSELLGLIANEIESSGYEKRISSVVVTGGSSQLPGLADLASQILAKPVRLGFPHLEGGLSSMVRDPRYSTAIGLIFQGLQKERDLSTPSREDRSQAGIWQRFRSIFRLV
ncbi:MAG: cell division protein FtsA [Deltaproteobacteria bacterium]|jgi:cell division protein FtsA|nr:cell division protein FtsA [Deltaproteobacteria bacterium]